MSAKLHGEIFRHAIDYCAYGEGRGEWPLEPQEKRVNAGALARVGAR
jgi:hypothetical protein